MNWSRYNFFFNAEGKYFLYNSLSNSFAELDTDTYHELTFMKDTNNVDIPHEELKEQLISMKALVEDDRDEINKIKYITQKRRFQNQHIGLTINPTLHCNFACPYCFENDHPNIYMTDEVEDELINYIKKHEEAKSIHVTWFGGEPLLAFNRIVSLTKRMQALGLKYRAGMITNGYLLTKEIASQLSSLDIQSIQITIDGTEPLHDSRRCLKSGKGTFQRIVENIDLLQQIAPEIKVIIRVNIDESNKDEYLDVFNYFARKKYPNLTVAPAFVEDLSGCNTNDCIFNAKKKAAFLMEMKKTHGMNLNHFYPSYHRYECPVRNHNNMVIGPSGELYKCWNDVGNKERIIGYLNGDIQNERLLMRYMIGADPFDDEECKSCLLLPVCGGGCPYSRIEKEYGEKHTDVCYLIKHNMIDFLMIHYHSCCK